MDKKCFIVCPISDNETEIRKRSDDLMDFIINPVCKEMGYSTIRVDLEKDVDKIDSTILEHLERAELAIVDITDHNPNVFYELGYRSALKKPIIQLMHEGESIPFDISTIRTITYSIADLRKANAAKEQLQATISNLEMKSQTITELSSKDSSVMGEDGWQQLVGLLFDIQSSIDGLYQVLEKNNNSVVERVVHASINEVKNAQPKDPNITLTELLLPELIKNPDGFSKALEVLQTFSQKT